VLFVEEDVGQCDLQTLANRSRLLTELASEEVTVNALPEQADVAIVGAGPVGLTMGIALAHYGVDAVVVDAVEQRSAHSKAAVVHSRTLEVLREVGAADELVDRGLVVPYFAFRDRDRTLLTADFGRLPTAYPYTLMLPQDATEEVLDERLRRLGGVVRKPWRVTGLHQDDAAAVLDLTDGRGEVRQLRARLCDRCRWCTQQYPASSRRRVRRILLR
jgi:2-polyprenyl-6-methoxyphenol hydroxylase-like FAD-dependent oxidoreductase